MRAKRRTIPGVLKSKVAMEALVGDRTINEIASENQVHATQVVQWKKQLKEASVEFFSDRRRKSNNDQEQLIAQLYQRIGQLQCELDWLKKKTGS